MANTTSVCVLGCGRLGQRIIGSLAGHGYRVTVFDRNSEALNSISAVIATDAGVLLRDGLIQNTDYVSNVRVAGSIAEAVSNADFVIEAVFDDLSLKRSLFQEVAASCRDDTILSTNSLNIDVNQIFNEIRNPARCCGMRFLFPVYFIPEVEIFRTQQTSMETIDKIQSFLENMGKVIYFRRAETVPLVLSVEQVDERRYAAQLRGNCFTRDPAFSGLPVTSGTSAWIMQRHAMNRQAQAQDQTGAINTAPSSLAHHGGLGFTGMDRNLTGSSSGAQPGVEYTRNQDTMSTSSSSNSLNATTATNLSTMVNVPAQQECVICCDAARDCTFVPCGHIAVCHACAQVLHFRREPCPICRVPIQSILRVYSP